MQVIIFFIVLTISQAYQMPICEIYEEDYKLDNTTCAKMVTSNEDTTVFLRQCSSKERCIFNKTLREGKCNETYPTRFPGELCESGHECLSGNCSKGYTCIGLEVNKECKYDYECKEGTFCHSIKKKCTNVTEEDGECLESVCDVGLICNGGKCVKMFSLSVNNKSTVAGACETLYVTDGVCGYGPKLVHNKTVTEPTPCENNICEYKFNKTQLGSFITSCTCGKSDKITAYCNPGIGDINLTAVFLYLLIST